MDEDPLASNPSSPGAGSGHDGSGEYRVSFRGVTKRFGSLTACDEVDLDVRGGEIHGLLGENGAGKSTLVKMLIGIHQPDSGEMLIDGRPHRSRDPRDAAKAGIAMVHQHFSLVPTISVWENVVLTRRDRISADRAIARVRAITERYGLRIDPAARVGDLTTGQRQRVEIIKCLWSDPRIIILDEPTSVLTRNEAIDLFDTLRLVLAEERRAVILISHKLDEVLAATDRVTVLRRGRVVARRRTADTDAAELAEAMVGRTVSSAIATAALGSTSRMVGPGYGAGHDAGETPPALALSGVTVERAGRSVLSIDALEVAPGEIMGVAGVEGNGQDVLAAVLAGAESPTSGEITVHGETVALGRPGATAAAGIAVVTEDRHHDGCALDLPVAENLLCDRLKNSRARWGLLSKRAMTRQAMALMEEYDIVTPSPWTPLRALSGGNQQRVVVARELSREPSVLVAAQATRGLDVSSAEFVLERILDVARRGAAVVFISSELDELLALSDRVAVIVGGRIVGVVDPAAADRTDIGLMMGGVVSDAA